MASMLEDLSLLTNLHRQVVEESGRAELLEITDALERRCRGEEDGDPAALVAALDPDTTARGSPGCSPCTCTSTNLAEERHRARSLRSEDGEYGGGADTGDIGPAVAAAGPDARARIERMRIHPVLTAHPTEARRRAVASALRRIAEHLDTHDDPGSGPSERRPARSAGCSRTSTSSSAPRPCASPGRRRRTRSRPSSRSSGSRSSTPSRASSGRVEAAFGDDEPTGRAAAAARSSGSARGSAATATATPSSPPR